MNKVGLQSPHQRQGLFARSLARSKLGVWGGMGGGTWAVQKPPKSATVVMDVIWRSPDFYVPVATCLLGQPGCLRWDKPRCMWKALVRNLAECAERLVGHDVGGTKSQGMVRGERREEKANASSGASASAYITTQWVVSNLRYL